MPRDPAKYLLDIQDAARFLLEFTRGRTFEEFSNDRGFRSAVQHELQIIGAAMAQLKRVAPEVAGRISEHDRIISFRNILVHGYDSIRYDLVWFVITDKLAVLLGEVEGILREGPAST
ncbi:MAG: hypothetical protein BIFFINMI_03108 [Phycisphaerae bacterium]|nr:hypothetical protein [Phycisphaerae bacterium]